MTVAYVIDRQQFGQGDQRDVPQQIEVLRVRHAERDTLAAGALLEGGIDLGQSFVGPYRYVANRVSDEKVRVLVISGVKRGCAVVQADCDVIDVFAADEIAGDCDRASLEPRLVGAK